MSIYSDALDTYLDRKGEIGPTQSDFAAEVGCTQAAISRYASGLRLPPRFLAERIEQKSEGKVPLTLWRIVAAEKAGLGDNTDRADAA